MATSRLNLTRDQLATFLKDHEQIKQFERLFATVDAIAPDFVNEVALSAGTAQATANDALALIEALENSLTADGAVIDAKATLALQELKKLKDQIELAVLHPAMPQLGTLSAYNEDNVRLIGFDTSPFPAVPNPAPTGTLYWDGNSTLGLQMSQGVLAKIAQSQFTYVKASSAITKGQLCKHTGAVGGSGVITAAPTSIGMTDPNQIVGVAAEDIPLNGFGFIQDSGDLRGFDTTGSTVGEVWADGDSLYYNPAYVGGLTNVKPSAPNLKNYIGEVINASSGGSGSIHIRISSGSVLGGTDSNVQFGTLSDKDLMQYDGTAQYWKNVAPSTISIGTATNLSGGAAGSVPYQTGANTTTFLPIGTASQVLKVNAGATAPEWVSGAALSKVDDTNVTLTLGGSPATSLLAATSLTLGWTGTLAVSRGGTGTGTSFTPGSVVFAGASGVYSQDNANLFWDDANNRLGIGTATPGSTLDVAGALNVTGNAVLGDATTDTVNLAGYMGVGGSVAINNTGINCETLALSGTSQRGIRARTVGTSAATTRIASFTAAPGTAAAAFTASEVVGYIALDSSRGAGSAITNQYGIKIDDQTRGANNFGLASAVSYDIGKWNIYANGTADNAFAGNVRIGSTTAPTFALDVTGVASVSSLIYCPLLIGGSGTTSSLQLRSTLGVGTTGADIVFQVGNNGATEAMRITNAGNVGIRGTPITGAMLSLGTTGSVGSTSPVKLSLGGTFSTSAGLYPKLSIYDDGVNNYGFGVSASQFEFQTPSGTQYVWYINAVEQARISSAGNFLLGTTAALTSGVERMAVAGATVTDVSGAYPVTAVFSDTRAYDSTAPSAGGGIGFGYKYNSAGALTIGPSIQGYKQNTTDGDFGAGLRILTRANGGQPAERMRIDSLGVALINTTTATNNVRLNQKLAVVSTGAGNYGGAALTTYGGTANDTSSIIDFSRSRGTTDGSFTAVASGDRLGYIIWRGADGSAFQNAASIRAEVDGTPGAGSMPGRLILMTTPSGSAASSERMRIDNAGNVGIGATANLSTLTVNGSFASKSPSTVNAATYTVAATDGSLRFTTTNCTVTLPAAASFPGRILYLNTITANSVTSAAANVIPLGSNTAGTAILAATAGKFAMIQSDGTNWITMMSN